MWALQSSAEPGPVTEGGMSPGHAGTAHEASGAKDAKSVKGQLGPDIGGASGETLPLPFPSASRLRILRGKGQQRGLLRAWSERHPCAV